LVTIELVSGQEVMQNRFIRVQRESVMGAKSSKSRERPGAAVEAIGSEDIRKSLEGLARKVVESRTAHLHALLTLNYLLRLPDAQRLFSEDLRQQARDLWLKVKTAGFQLEDPPLLFGIPDAGGDGAANGGVKEGGPAAPLPM
jgi:hypothetical protein